MTAGARWQQVTCRDCKTTYRCTPENNYHDATTLDDDFDLEAS